MMVEKKKTKSKMRMKEEIKSIRIYIWIRLNWLCVCSERYNI